MKFYAIPEQGYFIDYSKNSVPECSYDHYFCGSHKVSAAKCPNCKLPLLRFLALDSNDPKLLLNNTNINTLSLFFCWACNIASKTIFSYVVNRDNAISIIKYSKAFREIDFPYENYPIYFPGSSAKLVKITDEVQFMLRGMNSGELDKYYIRKMHGDIIKPKHQIGGEPYLVQGIYYPRCSSCKKRMPFFAAIGDYCNDSRGFTNNDYVQVLYFLCRKCRIVSSYQRCD